MLGRLPTRNHLFPVLHLGCQLQWWLIKHGKLGYNVNMTRSPLTRQSEQSTRQPKTTSTHLVLCKPGEIFFFLVLLVLSPESPYLALEIEGVWRVKGHHGGRRIWRSTGDQHDPSWLLAAFVTYRQRQQDGYTNHFFPYIYVRLAVSGFRHVDATWRYFDAFVQADSYSMLSY